MGSRTRYEEWYGISGRIMTLQDLVDQWQWAATVPEGHDLSVVVDSDHVLVTIHPGWDEEGEERGDPKYIRIEPAQPMDLLVEALRLLGLPAVKA